MEPAKPKTTTPTTEGIQREDDAHDASSEQRPTPYSTLSERKKIFTVCISSMVTFLTPIAAAMYLPALGPLTTDMNVSSYEITLTINNRSRRRTILTASFSDRNGSRPLLLASVLVFLISNIGLALQNNHCSPYGAFKPLEAVAYHPLRILTTVQIILDKHISLLLTCSAQSFCGTEAILSTLPILLERKYSLNPLRIGLCFLPFTLGGTLTRWNVGTLLDRNFKRHARYARYAGEEIHANHQTQRQLLRAPLEKARLQLVLPFLYLSCLCVIAFAWVMHYDVHLVEPLVMQFVYGNTTTAVDNCINNNLVVDLKAEGPAAALTAMNAVRHLTAAGAIAVAVPMIDAIGIGWVGTFIAELWCLVSPALWIVYINGQRWMEKRTPTP
ncbi:hypothetical protein BJX76DRAFT_358617 [Aspergillus varians]